jgi:hypothetical protein
LQNAGTRYIHVMKKLSRIFWFVAVVVTLALLAHLTFTASRWLNSGSGLRFWNTTSVVHEVQSLSDLVTVEFVMEKVVVLEDVKWYGENRVLLLAHGVVKAGIDLKRLQPSDVTIIEKKIFIKLPVPQVTDAYLDDKASQVIDHSTGLLRAFDKDLEQTARQNAVDDIARAARKAGILEEAEKRAHTALANLLKQSGFVAVEFR